RAAVADRRSIALSSRPEQGSALVRVESVSSRRSNGDVRIGHVVGNAGALAQIIKIDGHWEAASPGRAIKARKLFRVGLQLATGETLIVDHVILEEAAHGQISLPFRGWRSPVEPGDARKLAGNGINGLLEDWLALKARESAGLRQRQPGAGLGSSGR